VVLTNELGANSQAVYLEKEAGRNVELLQKPERAQSCWKRSLRKAASGLQMPTNHANVHKRFD
jgi:hypothetical protein